MKPYVNSASVCAPGPYGILYNVCTISYQVNEDESFSYTFHPNYSVIDLLGLPCFDGIPGLNLDLRREVYIRENMIPCFVSERVPPKNREDLYEILQSLGLEYLEPIEFMIRDFLRYSGDDLKVIRLHQKESITLQGDEKRNTASFMRLVLEHIAMGDDVSYEGVLIEDTNRKQMHDLLLALYARSYEAMKEAVASGISKAKAQGKYRGRKPIHVDAIRFLEMEELVRKGEITAKEAAKRLGISIDKYYRYKKSLK